MQTPAIRIAVLVTILATAGIATAQPKPGDLIVQTGNEILVIDLLTRQITTLATGRFGELNIGADNNSIVAIERGSTPSLRRIAPSGAQTTITTLSPALIYGPLMRDQDGSYLAGASNAVLRLSNSGVSTFATYSWPANGPISSLFRDGDTGDVVAALDNIPYLTYVVRRDAVSGTMTTIATMTRGGTMAHDQQSGHFFWAFTSSLYLVDRNSGGVLTTANLRAWQSGSVAVDQPTSLVFVTGYQSWASAVLLVSRTGVIIGTSAYLGYSGFGSVRMWGSRKLTGTGSGDRGSTYALRVSLPQSTGASYCCALSFAGMRPGIRFPVTTAHIAQDGLFLATACGRLPGLTSGFAGTLDANGAATARFQIPSYIPLGTVYTAAAVAVNPTRPGGVDVTEAIAIVVTK